MSKKITLVLIALMLLVVMVGTLVACGENGNGNDNDGVTYTITFDSMGGSDVASITVDANSQISAPQAPTKEGYTFLGWYLDSSYQTEWVFSVDKVSQNITLYAKWQISTEGEYIVTYNINRNADGTYASETKYTINQKAQDYVPTMEGNEGLSALVFNGWWISGYNDIHGMPVLTSKYDFTQTVSDDNLVLYAEWVAGSSDERALSVPQVQVDGNRYYWDDVEGATGYKVTLMLGDVEIYSQSNSDKSYMFDTSLEYGTYHLIVRANGNGVDTINSQNAVRTIYHQILPNLQNLAYDGSTLMLSWSAVENATSYTITVDGQEVVRDYEEISYSLRYEESGEHTVWVYAKRDGWQTSAAMIEIVKDKLKTPQNFTITFNPAHNNYSLSWDNVVNAEIYKVFIDGELYKEVDTTYTTLDNTIFANDVYSRDITIAAFDTDTDYYQSMPTEEITLNKHIVLMLEIEDVNAANVAIISDDFTLDEDGEYVVVELTEENRAKTITLSAEMYLGTNWYDWREASVYGGAYSHLSNELVIEDIPMPTNDRKLNADFAIDENLEAFEYTATKDTCVITGVKDGVDYSVVIPTFVTLVEEEALKESTITGITVHDMAVFENANGTFNNNLYISSVVINKGEIAPNMFFGCSNLTSLTLGNEVSKIGRYAFTSCGKLTSVDIPASVVSIGDYAFSNCTSLESVSITPSIQYIGTRAFYGTVLQYNVIDGINYIGNEEYPYTVLVEIVDKTASTCTINSATKIIASSAFYGAKVTNIVVPDGVSQIGEGAFANNGYFKTVTLPNTIKRIDKNAFYETNAFEGAYITDMKAYCEIEFGGDCASPDIIYLNDVKLDSIIIPDGTEKIGNYAFDNYSIVRAISIPDSVQSIGAYAFYNAKTTAEIEELVIPSSVQSIGEWAFRSCLNADGAEVALIIEEGLETIADNVFAINNFTSISLPSTLKTIEAGAFQMNGKLTSITLPQNLEVVGSGAFSSCAKLQSIVFPDSVKSIGSYAFQWCSALESITFGRGVESIGSNLVANCGSLLTSITFLDPDGWGAYLNEDDTYPRYSDINLENASTNASLLKTNYLTYLLKKTVE